MNLGITLKVSRSRIESSIMGTIEFVKLGISKLVQERMHGYGCE